MKLNKFVLIIALSHVSFFGFPQTEKFQRQQVENKIEFAGNTDSVWTYLSNLGNLQNLVPSTIAKSALTGNGSGSIVTITLQNNAGTIVEKVVELDNEKRIICYKMVQTPMPIRNYVASFQVTETNNSSITVVFKSAFEVQEQNKEQRVKAFNNLQIELLTNIKKLAGGK